MVEPGFGAVTLLWSIPAHFCSLLFSSILMWTRGFPWSSVGKESACNAGDLGSIPGSGRSPGAGIGNPLQYSCLENPMDREAWQATVHGVARVRHDWATKPIHMMWTRVGAWENLLSTHCSLHWENYKLMLSALGWAVNHCNVCFPIIPLLSLLFNFSKNYKHVVLKF